MQHFLGTCIQCLMYFRGRHSGILIMQSCTHDLTTRLRSLFPDDLIDPPEGGDDSTHHNGPVLHSRITVNDIIPADTEDRHLGFAITKADPTLAGQLFDASNTTHAPT